MMSAVAAAAMVPVAASPAVRLLWWVDALVSVVLGAEVVC